MTTGEGRVANYTDNLAVDLLPFLRLNLDLAVDARDRPTLENLSDAGRIVQETVTTCAGASIAVPCRARPVPGPNARGVTGTVGRVLCGGALARRGAGKAALHLDNA